MSSIDGTKRRHEEVSGGSDPMPPLGASAMYGPHDGQGQEERSFPAFSDADTIQASSKVNGMEASRRGNHWGQIQSIHNGRNAGKKGRPLDRRRRAEEEMERARQLAAQQSQQDVSRHRRLWHFDKRGKFRLAGPACVRIPNHHRPRTRNPPMPNCASWRLLQLLGHF